MDLSDVRNIQFLDLSEVDENERLRVLSSLQKNDPSVQLPWIKSDVKSLNADIKHRKTVQYSQQPPIFSTKTAVNYQEPIHNQPAVHNACINHNVSIPQQQSNFTNYSNSPSHTTIYHQTQQQQMYGNSPIPLSLPYNHSPVNHQHMPDSTANDYTNHIPPSTPHTTNKFGDGVNNLPHPVQEVTQVNGALPVTNVQINTTLPQQNGDVNQELVKEVSSPSNKSWASLFNSRKSEGNHVGSQGVEAAASKTVYNSALKETNNNEESICPIKHPRKAQFADPDCYRMGEYLINYNVDGRAVSLQPRGLINQSNYCYINSILQALIACPPVYNLLSGLAQNISSNEKKKPTPVIDGMCKFVKEFQHLPPAQRVRRNDKNQKKDQGILINCDMPFEPSWIYKMLNGIQTDLKEGRQEDAEEFLGCLLNGLNDEMLELIKLVKNENSDSRENVTESENEVDKEWQVMGPKNKGSVSRRTEFGKTPVSDIFGGFLKSKISRAGDQATENIQPFFTLPLNIEKVKTVREALEALVTKYQLEGVTSSKTNEEVEAYQQVMLDELPIVLILHLKCFDFKLDGCTKIIKALEFPIDLKIDTKLLSTKTNTAKEKQYKLFAVVYHDGKEASKGHYITDAFHVGYSSWLRYDDQSVKPVQEEHVLKPQGTRVPYLLFYRRSDTIRSK